jgi:hypothetical protein
VFIGTKYPNSRQGYNSKVINDSMGQSEIKNLQRIQADTNIKILIL